MRRMVVITTVVVMDTIQATTRDTLVLVEVSTGAGTQIILFPCILCSFIACIHLFKVL